jgi:hypothetical protein
MDARLAAYVAAAGGASILLGQNANAAVVADTTVRPFGINGAVDIDYNHDGQTDFQIDHDRVNLSGGPVDYLQVDKNDVNGAENPTRVDPLVGGAAETFPPNGTTPNNANETKYLTSSGGSYPTALNAGDLIGPDSTFDWQEGDNYLGNHQTIRANRLIDEDQGKVDMELGGKTAGDIYIPSDGPNWVGLNGEIRYVGVEMHLNGAAAADKQYGWIGVRIDNEADATGAVVGYGYETDHNTAIAAGDIGPVVANADYNDDGKVDGADFLVWQQNQSATTKVIPLGSADGTGDGLVNAADLAFWKTKYGTAVPAAGAATHAVPEPTSALMGALGGVLMIGCFAARKMRKARAQA